MADLPTHDGSHHTDSPMNLRFELEADDQHDPGSRPNSDPGPTGWRTPRASRPPLHRGQFRNKDASVAQRSGKH
jgi:hypothetical protein